MEDRISDHTNFGHLDAKAPQPSESGASPEVGPDVTVIVPIYNSAQWLRECLRSALGQTRVSLEVVCVNDGSTDDSLKILTEYASTDPRVYIINRPNGGLSVARNEGLAVASGRYTIFLDSDDYWRLDHLATLVARADSQNLDVLLFDAEAIFESKSAEERFQRYTTYYRRKKSHSTPVTGTHLMSALMKHGEYRASACLYLTRTELLRSTELRFITDIAHEDNPYTFTLLLNARRAAHERIGFYARRVRSGSIMTERSAERSATGYFISYLEMLRQCQSRAIPVECSADIGRLLQEVYLLTRKHFMELSEEARNRLRYADQRPDAFVTYLLLRRDRNQSVRLLELM